MMTSQVIAERKGAVATRDRAAKGPGSSVGLLVLAQAVKAAKAPAATCQSADTQVVAEVFQPVLPHPAFHDKTLLATELRAQVLCAAAVQPVMALHGIGLAEAPGAAFHRTGPGLFSGMGTVMADSVGRLGKPLAAAFKKTDQRLFASVGTHVDFQSGTGPCPEMAVGHRAAVFPLAPARF